MDMLKTLKILLQINEYDTSQDNLLNMILLSTKYEVYARCNRSDEDADDILNFLILDCCVEKYNKLGNEGKKSDSVGPLSTTFNDKYSDSIESRFGKCTRMKVLS